MREKTFGYQLEPAAGKLTIFREAVSDIDSMIDSASRWQAERHSFRDPWGTN